MIEEQVKMWEAILGGVATVAGAYFGSAAAFKFNRLQHLAEKTSAHVEECNRAVLLLSLQYSTLENYNRQRLDEFRDSAGRHLQLRANAPFEVEHLRINPAALAFLLGTDARDIPAELSILNDRFMNCVTVINARSEIHIAQYQPQLEKAMGPDAALSLNGSDVERYIGVRLTQTLKSLTDDIYDRVSETMVDIAAAAPTLHSRLKKVFPGEPLITFYPRAMREVPID